MYGLLPNDVAEELRNVPASAHTHPNYFFWSARSKRKSEVSNRFKIFGKILAAATEKHPKLFTESDGQPKPAHLHMLRDTFAVEYLLAGVPLEEVSRLLGRALGTGAAAAFSDQCANCMVYLGIECRRPGCEHCGPAPEPNGGALVARTPRFSCAKWDVGTAQLTFFGHGYTALERRRFRQLVRRLQKTQNGKPSAAE